MRSSSSRIATLLCTLAAGGALAATARIAVVAESTVDGPVVRLRDVARLEGGTAERLGETTLGPAPGAGETRTLEGSAVLAALDRAGLDRQAVTYTIPANVRVRRAAQDVPEAAVRTVVEAFLAETLGSGASDTVLRTLELPGPIRIPAGPWSARVIAPSGVPLVGRVRLQLEFAVADRPVKSVWVTADIGRYGPVVLLRRALGRGEAITADDLEVDRRDLAQLPRDMVAEPAAAVGMLARAPVAAFTPLRRGQLETPPTVHRGDAVMLVAERGALRITTPGEVREDAASGERVRVVNHASRKELVGHVVDATTVTVDF